MITDVAKIIEEERMEDLLLRLRCEHGNDANLCIQRILESHRNELKISDLEDIFEKAGSTDQLEQLAVLYASKPKARKQSLWRMFERMQTRSHSASVALARALIQKMDQLTLVEMASLFDFAGKSEGTTDLSFTYFELLELGKGIVDQVNWSLHSQSDPRK